MKREYTKIFSFIVGITLIISGIIYTIVETNKEAKKIKIKEENQIIDEIVDIYEVFQKKVNDFSHQRDAYLDKIIDYTSYYSGMEARYNDIIKVIKEYESKLSEIEDSAVYLNAHCPNQNYSSSSANSKCHTYIINFERTVNSFVGDIEFFNSKIKEYNNWVKESKKNEDYKQINEYISEKYPDYVDINNDGEYLGKNKD